MPSFTDSSSQQKFTLSPLQISPKTEISLPAKENTTPRRGSVDVLGCPGGWSHLRVSPFGRFYSLLGIGIAGVSPSDWRQKSDSENECERAAVQSSNEGQGVFLRDNRQTTCQPLAVAEDRAFSWPCTGPRPANRFCKWFRLFSSFSFSFLSPSSLFSSGTAADLQCDDATPCSGPPSAFLSLLLTVHWANKLR